MQRRRRLVVYAAASLLTAYTFFSLTTTSVPAFRDTASADTSVVARSILRGTDSLAVPESPLPVSTPAVVSVQPVVIEHGSREAKAIALTFDACATHRPSDYDEKITDILINTGTPATLFLCGKWMLEEAEHTKDLAANPLFEIGNHTFLHAHLRQATDEQIRTELRATQDIMDSLTGKRANLFRPPFGEYDERVVRIAASLGLKTVQFDLASGDPDPKIGKDRLISYVSTMTRNGSIVVMHINRRGWHTAEALPEIIARLKRRGFVFRTVSDLLRPSTAADSSKAH